MKFNTKGTGTKTTNLAGGEAYKQTSKLEFISLLLTSFVKSQFYRDEKGVLEQVSNLFNSIPDKKFIAKTAIYARTKFGMRSISHVVAGEIAKNVKGESWTKSFFDKIIYRVDDMSEIISYYISRYGKMNVNAVKKGFASAFTRFSEYQLAKYRGEGNAVSLVDVVNIVHPKATESLGKLMTGNLVSTDTWESELTRAGQNATNDEEKVKLKEAVWTRLINEKKIGYFALLRNLRNITEQAPSVLDSALKMLVDEKLIKDSLVLPFRFVTAYNEIEKLPNSGKVLKAINRAVDISLKNVPKFDGKTLVVLDTSGSMAGKPAEIGSLFSAILLKANDNADFMNFSDNAEYHSLNTDDSTITIAKSMNFRCGGTNFHAIFQKAKGVYDRIIILSDMQGWMGYDSPVKDFEQYKARTGANPFVYSFDLQGYGTLQFPENRIFCLAGFSDKVFDIMSMLESDRQALVNEIEAIEL
jgi:60 kDa SS-A/Ro ribonucleoprotein